MSDDYGPAWLSTELSEVIHARYELTTGITDPIARHAIQCAVHMLTHDLELIDELDRMQTGGAAA